MLGRLKNYILIGVVLAFFYFLMSHHIIFFDFKDFEFLEKNQKTFKNTFISLKQQSPEKILKEDDLREAGLGELMVEHGLLSDERLQQILSRIEMQNQ